MKCATCNEQINRPPSLCTGEKLFCDHQCYSKYKSLEWQGDSNPRWNGGLDKKECIVCLKEFIRRKKGKLTNKYCSMQCAAKDRGSNHLGEKHWNWKGGHETRYRRKIAPRPKPDRCEICNSLGTDFKKGLAYDHDHVTKKFRGWLCGRCNTAIGLVKEKKEILLKIIHYLKDNQ